MSITEVTKNRIPRWDTITPSLQSPCRIKFITLLQIIRHESIHIDHYIHRHQY